MTKGRISRKTGLYQKRVFLFSLAVGVFLVFFFSMEQE